MVCSTYELVFVVVLCMYGCTYVVNEYVLPNST